MYQTVSILVNLSHWFDHELKLKVDMYHAIKYVQNRDSRPIQMYDSIQNESKCKNEMYLKWFQNLIVLHMKI